MSEFKGRVAVVTGASSGIGRRTAELLAERGASVVLTARSADKLERIASPSGLHAIAGDISEPQFVESLFAETEHRFGPCDILINSAGMIDPAPLGDVSPERWDRMFAVNVRAIFLTCKRALPAMVAARRGAIVNVASISGVPGPEKFPGWVSYCASKGAVISLTEALAVEVKEAGVRVNSVSPGSVDTEMWAKASGGAPASMTPEEVAEAILFLASDRSRPISGQDLHVFSV
jgi:NAD(P)-dependent dehydrogenase (short-subunit alcohol dehydrogenase family)